jgi:hypothetical protein
MKTQRAKNNGEATCLGNGDGALHTRGSSQQFNSSGLEWERRKIAEEKVEREGSQMEILSFDEFRSWLDARLRAP